MRPDDGEPRISTRGRRDIMVADATAVRTELTRDEAGRLLGQTMALMAVTAGAFALDAYLGRNLAYQWGWLFFIGSLMCLVGVNAMARRSEQLAITVLFASAC
jgi:YD repeat-containing protein